ncbi:zinc ribbon domain-containing protein [Staphylococcus massiliensis]|uniref:zinc ribbon domain-containing protein n=1 Tax=Staphylococcus massiliensis TaxID=555791 RepID=UPI001EDE10BD|nr:zinc ribbon domain-containing protein [Staphylococcus massiliensis]MCG3401925.1 zinc ribbon domain-containing protein [Staphylococcus massiliensis]MCG3412413.1 zinc ribbon domain-containing protein [Staphylococcus massiliensis]
MLCPSCGREVHESDSFCGECGHKLKDTNVSNNSNNDNNQVSHRFSHIVTESKSFFKQAFTSHDQTIRDAKPFSFPLLGALFGLGVIVIALLFLIMIPNEVSYFSTSKGSIVIRLILVATILLAILVGLIFGLTKLGSKHPISFQKVLSDYMLVNTITLAIFVISVFCFILGIYSLAGFGVLLSLILFNTSAIYLITKYTSHGMTRFSSFYLIIIFIVIELICLAFLGESVMNQVAENFLNQIMGGGF